MPATPKVVVSSGSCRVSQPLGRWRRRLSALAAEPGDARAMRTRQAIAQSENTGPSQTGHARGRSLSISESASPMTPWS